MREQLQQYVALLFAGAQNCEEIQQEILQNTLDRYDDLISQGKVPEAAYRLAISGIGDINEILGTQRSAAPVHIPVSVPHPAEETEQQKKKTMRAIAIALYIICPVPVILLGTLGGDTLAVVGVCGLFFMIAAATAILIMFADKEEKEEDTAPPALKNINSIISAAALVIFFVVSFFTGSWHITWLIFPIAGAVKNLIRAIYDYREENKR